MPPWRIQHESHTCSEQSLRILMWNASYVQKHSIKPDRKSMKTRSEKNLEVCISTSLLDANRSLPDIKFGLKIVWKRHAGSWLSRLPLTKNWKIAGTFSQEHCSVFVGRWLQCSPAAPCLSRGFTSIQMFYIHIHTWDIESFVATLLLHWMLSWQRSLQGTQGVPRSP